MKDLGQNLLRRDKPHSSYSVCCAHNLCPSLLPDGKHIFCTNDNTGRDFECTRGIQYFCPCWFSADWFLFHLGTCIVNYTFYLSKDKIQYR